MDPMYDHWLGAPYQRDEDVDAEDEAYWESLMASEEVPA